MQKHGFAWRRHRLILLPLAALATGCVPGTGAQQTVDAWTGRPLAQLKEEWDVIGYRSDDGRTYEVPFGRNAESGTDHWVEQQPVSATQMIQVHKSEDYYIPRRDDCQVVFKTNEAGIIVGNQVTGDRCDQYVHGPGLLGNSGYGPPGQ